MNVSHSRTSNSGNSSMSRPSNNAKTSTSSHSSRAKETLNYPIAPRAWVRIQ